MRREFTINPSGEYEFVVGSSDNFLIMRNLTSDILLESDSFKNVVLSRSDTVDISKYQDMTLRLINQSARPISGEIQLSEVDIRIKEQRMSVDGGLVIDEIASPVVISEVQSPLQVAGITNPIMIEQRRLKSVFTTSRINLTEAGTTLSLDWHGNRGINCRDLMIQADPSNTENMLICGRNESNSGYGDALIIPPGGVFSITGIVNGQFLIKGKSGTCVCGYVKESIDTFLTRENTSSSLLGAL
ncbi:hypothetical protein M2H12_14930 [Vibrio vulnificus]|nr:hypothetical protein [Vibrio vulnificus]MCU8166994.1 hypothetical protein [Vibrio vulnificus]MCU8171433.1 hypothetical protein [Vibrio vulnificus]